MGVVGPPKAANMHPPVSEQGCLPTKAESRRQRARMARVRLHQEGRGQRAVHDEVWIAFLTPRIGQVVVNAVAIERERRIAEQENRVGFVQIAPVGWRVTARGR